MEVLHDIKTKIELNKEEKRTRLLDSAFDLFSTKGFGKTSIQDIVNGADVAKGTFYLYFKNKEDIRNHLVAAKVSTLFEAAINDLQKEEKMEFDHELLYVINHVIDHIKGNAPLLHFINRDLALAFYSHEVSHIFGDNAYGLYTMFMDGVKKNNIPLENPDITFFMIVELVGTTCYRTMFEKVPCDIDAYRPMLEKGILAILHNT